MDGEEIAPALLHAPLILGARKHGQHGGVPVVAVDDLRLEIKSRQRLENGTAEEGVLLSLRESSAVYPVAEVVLAVHKVDRHAVQHELFYPGVLRAPAEMYVEMEHMLRLSGVSVLYAAMVRRDDARVYPELFQGLWQRADHVREAPRL